MKHTNKRKALGLLLVGFMLLTLMGAAPAKTFANTVSPQTTPAPEGPVVEVKDVDEQVAAIAPNVTVKLAPGEYRLANAATYGTDTGNPYCRWEYASETGYELIVFGVDGLTIQGAGMDKTTLLAQDRYANVLSFHGCQDVTLSAFTAGHSPAPGFCSGGVLHLVNCDRVMVELCGLFGCGSMGVWAANCSDVTVTGSRIYECSDNAVSADNCRNVQVLDSEIDHNGWKGEYEAYCLFQTYGGDGFTVSGCQVHDNNASLLLQSSYTRSTRFAGCQVSYNKLRHVFTLFGDPAVVDGCAFRGNDVGGWYLDGDEQASLAARTLEGKTLSEDALEAMELRAVELPDLETAAPQEPAQVTPGGEIVVTTVDEFLAAIGPDRTIVLDGESFSLADASTYGSMGGLYYRWEETYDGPQLVIFSVSNMTIRAAAERASVTLTAVPRYANVIGFESCDGVSVVGLTLGHTEGPSDCCGAVLDFESCNSVSVEGCRLYGCGTLGINASYGRDLKVKDCEIYDCSIGGAVLYTVYGATFENCRIHDVPSPALCFYNCSNVLWNGTTVDDAHYDVNDAGELVLVNLG